MASSESSSSSSAPVATFSLDAYVEKVVSVITNDGRHILGTLKGFDQTINIILANAHERVYSPDQPVLDTPLGVYLLRGDFVALIGELDEDLDSRIDLDEVRALPMKVITHTGL